MIWDCPLETTEENLRFVGQQTFSVKNQIENILGFPCYMISVITTPLCCYSRRSHRLHVIEGCDCIPGQIHLQRQVADQMWPAAIAKSATQIGEFKDKSVIMRFNLIFVGDEKKQKYRESQRLAQNHGSHSLEFYSRSLTTVP